MSESPRTFQERFESWTDNFSAVLAGSFTPWLQTTSIVLVICLVLLQDLQADPDLFARVAVGRLVEIAGGVIIKDPFSYLPTHEVWYDHEWLAGVVFYRIAAAFGDYGLFVFKLLICWLTVYLLIKASEVYAESKHHSYLLAGLGLFAYASIWGTTVRSRVFTFLFLALLLYGAALFRVKRRARLLWLLPPIMFVWANTHGGFVVGLFCLTVFAAVDAFQHKSGALPLLAALIASAAASLINPYGFGYIEYIIQAVGMQRVDIPEWRAPQLLSMGMVLPLSFIALAAFAIIRRRVSPEGAVITVLCAYQALNHARMIPFAMFSVIVFCGSGFGLLLHDLRQCAPRWHPVLRRSFSAVTAGLLLFSAVRAVTVLAQPRKFALDYADYPVSALEWLWNERNGGKVLLNFDIGSYALWRLYPLYRISVDGRYEEVYSSQTVRSAMELIDPNTANLPERIAQNGADYILIPSRSEMFQRREVLGDNWTVAYKDNNYSVLERRNSDKSPSSGGEWMPRDIWRPSF